MGVSLRTILDTTIPMQGAFLSPPILPLDPKPWRTRGEGWGGFWRERGGAGQRARGFKHQGMGLETDYIAKGFNFLKQNKTPDTPDPHGSRTVQGKGVRIFLKGTDLFPTSPHCSPICHTYPAF